MAGKPLRAAGVNLGRVHASDSGVQQELAPRHLDTREPGERVSVSDDRQLLREEQLPVVQRHLADVAVVPVSSGARVGGGVVVAAQNQPHATQ